MRQASRLAGVISIVGLTAAPWQVDRPAPARIEIGDGIYLFRTAWLEPF